MFVLNDGSVAVTTVTVDLADWLVSAAATAVMAMEDCAVAGAM